MEVLHHKKTIWNPEITYGEPAKEEDISEAEIRLGVRFPEILKQQLRAHNGGQVYFNEAFDPFPASRSVMHWTNAAVDRLMNIQTWTLASDEEDLEDEAIEGLDKLVLIAQHSESHLLLDYRTCGPEGMPDILSVFYFEKPLRISKLDEFILRTIDSKFLDDDYDSIVLANAPIPCYQCGNPLAKGARKCDNCGEVFW